MENIKHCVLCLEQILGYKFETVENLNLDKLGLILNKEAVICCKCCKISKLLSNFKTTCINNYEHLKTFVHPEVDTKLVLEGVIITQVEREIKCDEERVCLLCLKYFEVNSLIDLNLGQDILMKDMFERCLPEIDTTIAQSPSICYNCKGILVEHCNFISLYKDTEALRNLKKETDNFVKPEMLNANFEDAGNYVDGSFVKIEENHNEIEEPPVEQTENNIPIDENFEESLDETGEVSKLCGDITNKKFACDLCPYRSKRHYDLKIHYYDVHKVLKELKGFKCEQCLYIMTKMSHLIDHRLTHGLETSQFRCAHCSFVSQRKSSLIQHSRLHKDPLKTKSSKHEFKCPDCPYTGSRKWDLSCHMKRHEKLHETNEEVTILTCNRCSFTTKRQSSLVKHYKLHKDAGGEFREKNIVTVKLSNGLLKTKIIEASVDTLNTTFDCDKCTYRTSKKWDLNNHYLVHLDLSEVQQFKCTECSYVTKRQSSLSAHRLVHKDPLERKTYGCTKCSFEAKSRSTLSTHFRKNHVDGGLKTYICYECNYTTTYRSCIVTHLKTHRQGKNIGKVRKGKASQKIH